MESLFLLVPLSIAVVFLIGWLFWRALEGGQFDDLEKPGIDVLMDDDRPRVLMDDDRPRDAESDPPPRP
jgi:cbb3-type cytochrome oxidase maturation protein